MTWIVAILSVFLIIACLLLMLLILIQLPKKEAGMGQAFGGGATDALFGAGSGTALTKMTKYTTVTFFVLTLFLWVLKAQEVKSSRSTLEKKMQELGKTERPASANANVNAPKATPPVTTNSATAPNTNALISAPTDAAPKTGTPPKPEADNPK
jgi:preprotein translocase subunit SecG